MSIKEGTYVIARAKDQKVVQFIKVKKVDEDTVTGWLESSKLAVPHSEVVEVKKKDIRCVLGKNPDAGNVYGVDTGHRFRKTLEHSFWGSIHLFTELDGDTLKVLKKGLDTAALRVEKLRLEKYVGSFSTEIRAKKGKYAGMYIHSPKDERHRVWYAPECAGGSIDVMAELVLHEFGHVLRYQGLTNNVQRSKWLKLYNKSVAKNIIDKDRVKLYLKNLMSAKAQEDDITFYEALKELSAEDDDKENLKTILKWFKQVHRLSAKELDLLWSVGELDHISSLWPTSSLDHSKLRPLVTEYALKNVEELWAESFAFYANKKKLPEKVESLLENSLSVIRQS